DLPVARREHAVPDDVERDAFAALRLPFRLVRDLEQKLHADLLDLLLPRLRGGLVGERPRVVVERGRAKLAALEVRRRAGADDVPGLAVDLDAAAPDARGQRDLHALALRVPRARGPRVEVAVDEQGRPD